MKSMAMTTFIVFTFAVLAKGFSHYNAKILYAKVDEKSPLLFEQENKEQLRAELLSLSDVYTETVKPSDQRQPMLAEKKFSPDINELERYYFDSFVQNFISFDDIRSRQNEIVDLKIDNKSPLLPSDTYDLFLIYYLLIVEGMGINEINQIESLYDLFPDDPDLERLNKYVMSDTFAREVLSYVGADEDDHFDQESLALSLVPDDGYQGDLIESLDWDGDQQHRTFASEEQEAIYKHLQEFRISPEEVRELVQGYQVSLPRF